MTFMVALGESFLECSEPGHFWVYPLLSCVAEFWKHVMCTGLLRLSLSLSHPGGLGEEGVSSQGVC